MAEQLPVNQGRLRLIAPVDPAAGMDWVIVQDIRTRWRIVSVQATFITSVNAGNRLPELQVMFGALPVVVMPANVAQAPNVTLIHQWGFREVGASPAGSTVQAELLPEGMLVNDQATLAVITVAMDLGDQWSNIRLLVEEWIEPLV